MRENCRDNKSVCEILLDLFPKPAAIRNIRKDELAFVKRERSRVFVFAEDKLQCLTFRAPMSGDGRGAIGCGHDPILGSAIGVQNQMFVAWTSKNDGGFAPVANKRARIFRNCFRCNLIERDVLR